MKYRYYNHINIYLYIYILYNYNNTIYHINIPGQNKLIHLYT